MALQPGTKVIITIEATVIQAGFGSEPAQAIFGEGRREAVGA